MRMLKHKAKPNKSFLKIIGISTLYVIIVLTVIGVPFAILTKINEMYDLKLDIVLMIIAIIFFVFFFLIIPFRLNLVKKEYFKESTSTIWEAHKQSEIIFNLYLSYIPIVGLLFKTSKKNDSSNKI